MQAEFLPINLYLRNFNVQLGWDFMHYRSKLGSDQSMQIKLKNEHFFSYRARVSYNSEDNWYFPTRGARFKAEYAYMTNDFGKLNVRDAEGNKLGKKAGMNEVNGNVLATITISCCV